METQKNLMIGKAARIIMNSGVQELTIPNLAVELNVEQSQLYKWLTKDDDILLMLLLGFETDVSENIKHFTQNNESPETELKILFKKLYFLFLQKPYYLDIIFDKNLKDRDESIKESIFRIRNMAENYLSSIINKGKNENTFKTNVPTKVLVGKILANFRLFMKEEQLVHELILEMKTLKISKD